MTATIECKCRYRTEIDMGSGRGRTVRDFQVEAEVVADRHESADYRRPYRHETTVTLEGAL